MKISEYTIIPGRTVSELEEKVKYFLTEGFCLQGGVGVSTVADWSFYQAMVKYE